MLIIFLLSINAILSTKHTWKLDQAALNGKHIKFEPHNKPLPFGSYLQLTLNYTYFVSTNKRLNYTHNGNLKSRGESHITVINPVEYSKVLSKVLTIEKINILASQMNIQSSHLKAKCIGRAIVNEEVVYFVVLHKYKNLLKIRQKIFDLYKLQGGEPSKFDPLAYWPHITLAFSKRDFFVEDGVYKGLNSCWKDIK